MSSLSKVYTVNPQTTLSRIVCSPRNNKICPSRGNGKKLNFIFFIIQLSSQTMLMKGSYTTTFIAYIKSHQLMRVKKFSVMGEQKLLKMTAIVSALRPIPAFKNDIWH